MMGWAEALLGSYGGRRSATSEPPAGPRATGSDDDGPRAEVTAAEAYSPKRPALRVTDPADLTAGGRKRLRIGPYLHLSAAT
jgi:hypothetical protein